MVHGCWTPWTENADELDRFIIKGRDLNERHHIAAGTFGVDAAMLSIIYTSRKRWGVTARDPKNCLCISAWGCRVDEIYILMTGLRMSLKKSGHWALRSRNSGMECSQAQSRADLPIIAGARYRPPGGDQRLESVVNDVLLPLATRRVEVHSPAGLRI
jgi:hypothetical protein